MKQPTMKHNIDGLAALLLFGIFAACVLSVLLSGAGAYRRLTQRDLTAYDRRPGLSIIMKGRSRSSIPPATTA